MNSDRNPPKSLEQAAAILPGHEPSAIEQAASILKAGGLVAFPTETVYGLGADASNAAAVARVFAAKGRPPDHPLIVHLPAAAEMERYGRAIPSAAWRLAEQHWPGPLTLILKRAEGVSDLISGGQDTVGLRVPAHPVAQHLLQQFGSGIAAPSANRFGRISPTTAEHVMAELRERIDCVLDGGACQVGLESTILDLSGGPARILRPGMITPQALAESLGELPQMAAVGAGPRAPGRLASHYAPRTPLRVLDAAELKGEIAALRASGSAAVLAMRASEEQLGGMRWVRMPAEHNDYAHQLFARLRELDDEGHACILVERPPAGAEWDAVHDRLSRAASV